jgi:hypothetical protein
MGLTLSLVDGGLALDGLNDLAQEDRRRAVDLAKKHKAAILAALQGDIPETTYQECCCQWDEIESDPAKLAEWRAKGWMRFKEDGQIGIWCIV